MSAIFSTSVDFPILTATGLGMRIWDIDPGYLNRQSLLAEHRELHAIVSNIIYNKKGQSHHPETLRWMKFGWALKYRHLQLSCEMQLRGNTERTPVRIRFNAEHWPENFIDTPAQQFELLNVKYRGQEKGRIPLPKNLEQLWRQHKYSVLARDPKMYKTIGQMVANKNILFPDLAITLVKILRDRPQPGGITNAVQHMWGYVSDSKNGKKLTTKSWTTKRLLLETQHRAMIHNIVYLRDSTALGELMVWLSAAKSTNTHLSIEARRS